jgi:hypothetical protein
MQAVTVINAAAGGDDERQQSLELLDLADSIQEEYDARSRRLANYSALRAILSGAIVVTAAVAITVLHKLGWAPQIAAAFGGLLYVAIIELYTRPNVRKLQRLQRRDQRALSDLSSLLREIEPSLMKDEKWSPLDRAQFKIRLARFDIDPDRNE